MPINRHEIVDELPITLEPNTLYFVNASGSHRVVSTDETANIIEYLEVNKYGQIPYYDFNEYYWQNVKIIDFTIPVLTDVSPTTTLTIPIAVLGDFDNAWVAYSGISGAADTEIKSYGPQLTYWPGSRFNFTHQYEYSPGWFKISKDYTEAKRSHYVQTQVLNPSSMFGYGYSDLGLIFDSYTHAPVFGVTGGSDRIRLITGWIEFSTPSTMNLKLIFTKTSSGNSTSYSGKLLFLQM